MRTLVALAGAALLLAILILAAGEVLGRPAAENAIGTAIAVRYELPRDPEVTITGFPFVVRTALGRVDAVEVTLRDHDAAGLRLRRFTLRLHDVRFRLIPLLRGTTDITAERGTAAAEVGDQDLSAYLQAQGVPVTVVFRGGRVEVTGPTPLGEVTGAGDVAIAAERLRFTPREVLGVSLDAVAEALTFEVPLPPVAGVHLTGLWVGEGSATLTADVTGYLVPRLR